MGRKYAAYKVKGAEYKRKGLKDGKRKYDGTRGTKQAAGSDHPGSLE